MDKPKKSEFLETDSTASTVSHSQLRSQKVFLFQKPRLLRTALLQIDKKQQEQEAC